MNSHSYVTRLQNFYVHGMSHLYQGTTRLCTNGILNNSDVSHKHSADIRMAMNVYNRKILNLFVMIVGKMSGL
jgi:hypothetical protein